MYTITKRFDFEASHRLGGLPEGHKCSRMHGHSYRVEIVLESEQLDERGFVVDYGELKPLGDLIDRRFDHCHLNDFILQPTAENIARTLYEFAVMRWPQTVAVRVSETAKTWATYQPKRN